MKEKHTSRISGFYLGQMGFWLVLVGIAVVLFIASFSIGYYDIAPREVIKILLSKFFTVQGEWQPEMEIIVWNIRFPRIIAAMLVGASLSMAGAAYQGMFKNPLAQGLVQPLVLCWILAPKVFKLWLLLLGWG